MSQEQGEDTRKIRSHNEGKRQYGCPCGKTYLSYPALFTHVKQKHDGRAPGHLIKPRTQKARGRPKIHIDIPQDDMSDGAFNLQEQIQEILEGANKIDYNEAFIRSDGNRSCQDMASQFLNKLSDIDIEGLRVINCFLNLLRHITIQKFGNNYWIDHKPNQLIDLVNETCKNHTKYSQKYPIEQQVLVDMFHVLFRWMYKTKWTDHKLIKREPVKKIV